MTAPYRTVDGVTHQMQIQPGDNGGLEERFVHGLPAGVVTDIQNTASRLATIITSLSTLQGYTDTLEALIAATNTAIATLDTHVDGLEGFTDGLETLITSTNTKLDTLHTDLSPATTLYGARTLVTAASTRVPLGTSQAFTKGVWVRALATNLGIIYVGDSTVSSTAGGTDLSPGEAIWLDVANRSTVYIDSSVSGEGVKYLGW